MTSYLLILLLFVHILIFFFLSNCLTRRWILTFPCVDFDFRLIDFFVICVSRFWFFPCMWVNDFFVVQWIWRLVGTSCVFLAFLMYQHNPFCENFRWLSNFLMYVMHFKVDLHDIKLVVRHFLSLSTLNNKFLQFNIKIEILTSQADKCST